MMLNPQAPPFDYFYTPFHHHTPLALGYPSPCLPPLPSFDTLPPSQFPPASLCQPWFPRFSPCNAPIPAYTMPYCCAIAEMGVYYHAVHQTPCKALSLGIGSLPPPLAPVKGVSAVECGTGGLVQDASGGGACGAQEIESPVFEEKEAHVVAEKARVSVGVPRHSKKKTMGTGRRMPAPRHRCGRRPVKEGDKFVWLPKGPSGPLQPRSLEFQIDDGSTAGVATTVMVRNIPNKYSREMIMLWLDAHCLGENRKVEEERSSSGDAPPPLSEYDFLYLPIDFRNKVNLGYAFVNMTTAVAASRLYKAAHGTKWGSFRSRKTCEICLARIQGKQELIDNFRNSTFRCESDEYLPAVFSPPRDGVASPMPPPVSVGARQDPSRLAPPPVPTECPSLVRPQE